ncbi:MAG: TIGR02147 family protein [Chitinispirillaceae bacterium]|nr:TIGR02147 family protein [Chitinispirillaceae bacterium]
MHSVFSFIDYRKYLAALYQEKKKTTRYFSYRYFSNKAGIHSPSFFKQVVDGKRNLTRPLIEKFGNALKLTAKEAVYFRNLVLFNQAKTSGEKQEYYAVLRAMSGGVKESVLKADQYDYFANWYNPVIRELVCLHDFKGNYKKLAESLTPSISPADAKKSVRLLLRLNLVKRQADGRFRQRNPAVTADEAINSMAVRAFTKAMLDNSKKVLDTVDRTRRHISGLTIGISPETYDVIAAEIEAFKDRVKIIVSQDSENSRVYQMNLSLFPVSKDMRRGDPGGEGEARL